MKKTPLALLDSYASVFRSLINSMVQDRGKADVKVALCLNTEQDWMFLCSATDIIEDASKAIAHVQRFGLNGATKYDDIGEKYLRLYGLLSAIYSQQQSVLKIYQIMNVPNLKKTKGRFDILESRILRHKLVAHGTDFDNPKTNKLEAHVPLRFELGDRKITSVNYTAQSHQETFDITVVTENHINLCIEVMDMILEKSIITLHKGRSEKQKDEYVEKLTDLRTEKNGGIVIIPVGGPKIIVTFVGGE